jgi:hypothetical protein
MTDMAGAADSPCQCGPCAARAQTKRVRYWHWLTEHSDLAKPPAPLLRWFGVLLVGIVYVAVGSPAALGDWLWFAIIGGFLIFPDVAGFGVAGVRLDLKKTQDELNAVKLRLEMRQTQNLGGIHFHGPAEERTFKRTLGIEIGEKSVLSEDVTLIDADPPQDDLPS